MRLSTGEKGIENASDSIFFPLAAEILCRYSVRRRAGTAYTCQFVRAAAYRRHLELVYSMLHNLREIPFARRRTFWR